MAQTIIQNHHLHRVVVTGLGILSPNGNGVENFWNSTIKGISGVRRIEGFDIEDCSSKIAGQILDFNPKEVLPERDLKNVSRAVPMALIAAKEALNQASINTEMMEEKERQRFGVILGSGGGCIEFTERQYKSFFENGKKQVSLYNVPSSTMGNLSSEISIAHQLRGMSHIISTGCSSSTDAIGYAFLQLRSGRLNAILTGGVDATVTPGIMTGFSMMKILSTTWNEYPTRASRPFDKSRDGFVLGEGAWIIILETLEHAQSRNAPILAEVAGYGSTCEAYHRVRLAEDGQEPARAIQLAIEDANVAKDEIGYINLHGTSTSLNDRIETKALKLCFSKRAYDIPMSSLKSMIGHPQGASGAAGIAAILLGMASNRIPPTINYENQDPECDLDYVPNQSRRAKIDVAIGNCLGFGSKSSAIVIKRYNG